MEALAADGSAQRGGPARRAGLCHAAPYGANPNRWRPGGEPGRFDERYRQRLGCEVDRRLSRRSSEPARNGWLPAEYRHGHFSRAIPGEFREAEGHHAEYAANLQIRAPHGGSRLPARAPDHGANTVKLVPTLRSQPANLRAEYVLCETRRLCESDATDLSRTRHSQLHRSAGSVRRGDFGDESGGVAHRLE